MAIVRSAEARDTIQFSNVGQGANDPAEFVNRGEKAWTVALSSYTYAYRVETSIGASGTMVIDLNVLPMKVLGRSQIIVIAALKAIQLVVVGQADADPTSDGTVAIDNNLVGGHTDLFGGQAAAAIEVGASGTFQAVNPDGSWDSSVGSVKNKIQLINRATMAQMVRLFLLGD